MLTNLLQTKSLSCLSLSLSAACHTDHDTPLPPPPGARPLSDQVLMLLPMKQPQGHPPAPPGPPQQPRIRGTALVPTSRCTACSAPPHPTHSHEVILSRALDGPTSGAPAFFKSSPPTAGLSPLALQSHKALCDLPLPPTRHFLFSPCVPAPPVSRKFASVTLHGFPKT